MKSKRRMLLSLIGLSAAVGLTAAFSMPSVQDTRPDSVKAKVGEKAPDFTLKDSEGKAHSLSDFKGKIVVLEWLNPGCPVCRRVTSDGTVATMAKELKALDKDIVILGINSTAGSDAQISREYLDKNDHTFPALDDSAGKVGKMYGARTTPHMFVIDKDGILRYNGAIDNGNGGKKGDVNYVVNAVTKILADETVTPDVTRPYGCSVKYARN